MCVLEVWGGGEHLVRASLCKLHLINLPENRESVATTVVYLMKWHTLEIKNNS